MKSKEIQELKIKSEAELTRLIQETSDRIRALRFDLAAGKVKNVNELRQARKKVARMKTFMKQK
jgi:ribosomal protein L29